MRIALISDIHANEFALRAVLEDIRSIGANQIVCLGDVATLGASPAASLRLIREAAGVCIMGNHDEFLIRPELVEAYTKIPPVVASIEWCRRQLSEDDLDFVRTFLPACSMPLADGSTLFLYHGSPRSNTEDLLATTPPDDLDQMIAGHAATVLAGGHTHVQMLRQHKGMLVVNAGSVGQPFREYRAGREPELMPYAEYAIVEELHGVVSVELRRVPLDKAALRHSVSAVEHPLRGWLLQQYSSTEL